MIVEKIMDGVFALVYVLVSLLPEWTFSIPDGVLTGVGDVVSGIGYVLPIAGLLPIFYLSMAQTVFRVVMSVVVRIKSFIPLMGGA